MRREVSSLGCGLICVLLFFPHGLPAQTELQKAVDDVLWFDRPEAAREAAFAWLRGGTSPGLAKGRGP